MGSFRNKKRPFRNHQEQGTYAGGSSLSSSEPAAGNSGFRLKPWRVGFSMPKFNAKKLSTSLTSKSSLSTHCQNSLFGLLVSIHYWTWLPLYPPGSLNHLLSHHHSCLFSLVLAWPCDVASCLFQWQCAFCRGNFSAAPCRRVVVRSPKLCRPLARFEDPPAAPPPRVSKKGWEENAASHCRLIVDSL